MIPICGGGRCTCIALMAAVFAVAGPGVGQSQSVARAEALSLRQAVAQALDRSPAIENARTAIDQANLSLRLAHSAFTVKIIPNMLGSFGQTSVSNQSYGVNVSQKFFSGTEIRGNVGATTYNNQLGNYYNSDATLQLSQPLLRGFGSSVATRPLFDAEWRVTDAGRQLTLTEQQVALDVAGAYYTVIVQKRLVEVARSALARAGNLRDASVARLATGRVSQLDVLRAQQLAGRAEVQLLDAEGALADAQDKLRVLIGRAAGDNFSVDERISADTESMDAEQAASLALSRRPELHTALDSIAEAERGIAAARSQLRPQVDLSLALTRRETASDLGSSFGLDRFRVATFATISMPVDRTAEDVGLQGALLERTRRQRDLDSLRDRVAQEARQAARRQARAVKTRTLERSSVELAETELEVATFRFQRGLSNNLDVISAQATLRGAESEEIGAQAEVAVARLALRAATGVLDPRQDIR